MGIYDKSCPQCTATNSTGAMRCVCGYLFDSTQGNGSKSTPELVADEERLFEEYLEARVAQALEVARVAAHAAEMEPDDGRKAVKALRAKQAADAAEAELAIQRVKAAQAADAARREAQRTAAGALLVKRNGVAKRTMSVAPATPTPGLEVTHSTDDNDLHKQYLTARAAQASTLARTNRATSSQAPTVQRKAPGKAFRAAQAAKAARVMRATDSRKTQRCPWCGTSIAARAERCLCGWSQTIPLIEEVVAADSEPTIFDKACPQCGTTLYVAATRCTCGYVFGFRRGQGSWPDRQQTVGQEKTSHEGLAARPKPMVRNAGAQREAKAVSADTDARIGKVAYRGSSGIQRAVPVNGTLKTDLQARAQFKAAAARKAKRLAKAARAARNKQRKTLILKFARAKMVRANEVARTWRRAIATHGIKAAKVVLTAAARTATNVVRAAQEKARKEPMFATQPRALQVTRTAHSNSHKRRIPAVRAAQATKPKQKRDFKQTGRSSKAAKIAKAVRAARALDTAKGPSRTKAGNRRDATMECPLCTALLHADATHCVCGWLVPAAQREIPVLITREKRAAEDIESFDCPIECPACTATIPAGMPRCGCGWQVPEGEREMPPLVLSAEERSALAQGVGLKKSY